MKYINVDTYINQFLKSFKPYKSGKWCYEDGIILSGSWYLYRITEDERYFDFILSYLNNSVSGTGTLSGYTLEDYNIDNINPGKVLFDAYQKTGQEKYKQAIHLLYMQLRDHPRTKGGNFWHKKKYPYHRFKDNFEGNELVSTDEETITLALQGDQVLFDRYYNSLPEGVSHKLEKPED